MNLDSTNEKEGISKIKGTELYLDEALEKYPREILETAQMGRAGKAAGQWDPAANAVPS